MAVTLLPTFCIRGMRYYYGERMSIYILLASERSERETIRGVQIRAGAVYVYMYGGTYAIIVAHATYT